MNSDQSLNIVLYLLSISVGLMVQLVAQSVDQMIKGRRRFRKLTYTLIICGSTAAYCTVFQTIYRQTPIVPLYGLLTGLSVGACMFLMLMGDENQ